MDGKGEDVNEREDELSKLVPSCVVDKIVDAYQ